MLSIFRWSLAGIVVAGVLSVHAGVAQQSTSFQLASAVPGRAPAVDPGYSSSAASGEASAAVVTPPVLPVKKDDGENRRILPFSRISIGTKIGTFGWGGQIATPITRQLNLRGGADFFNMGYGLTSSGTNYYASMHLKTGTVQGDYYPFRHSSFHVSPGILIFKSNVAASMFVPAGNTFTENNVDYTSAPNDPVHGNGAIAFGRTVMPMFTIGFGNMITRRETRHWSPMFEIGAAYTGHNTMSYNLAGSVCSSDGCGSVNDPSVAQNVTQEQNKINEEMKRFQIYPIITTGVSYRF